MAKRRKKRRGGLKVGDILSNTEAMAILAKEFGEPPVLDNFRREDEQPSCGKWTELSPSDGVQIVTGTFTRRSKR